MRHLLFYQQFTRWITWNNVAFCGEIFMTLKVKTEGINITV
jgi:hypothetical protein